jgi:hypothetical protein
LVGATVIIIATFLTGPRSQDDDGKALVNIGAGRGWFLGSLYVFWTLYIVATAKGWIEPISKTFFS